jgi:hypothetical protein
MHAIERGLPLPIGTQNAAMLDTTISDADEDFVISDDDPQETSENTAVNSARKLWERLNRYRTQLQRNPAGLSQDKLQQLESVLGLIWRYPLKRAAQDAISRQMRLGITDGGLLDLVAERALDENLCEVSDDEERPRPEPQLICSMGLVRDGTMRPQE